MTHLKKVSPDASIDEIIEAWIANLNDVPAIQLVGNISYCKVHLDLSRNAMYYLILLILNNGAMVQLCLLDKAGNLYETTQNDLLKGKFIESIKDNNYSPL